jgi:hypothetical protein
MGLATLGFAGGPGLTFRIDPESIDYNVTVHTSVTNTVGGRVIQVLGTSISDVTIRGSIGESHSMGKGKNGAEHDGVSWKMAIDFFQRIQSFQMLQSAGANTPGSSSGKGSFFLKPATFVYSPKGLRFQCYIKAVIDPAGDGSAGVVHRVGRSNYQYVLVLFPVQEGTTDLTKAGTSNGVLDQAKAKAVDAYISRISQGIGWKFTAYNGGSTPSAEWEKEFKSSHSDATPDTTLDREDTQ